MDELESAEKLCREIRQLTEELRAIPSPASDCYISQGITFEEWWKLNGTPDETLMIWARAGFHARDCVVKAAIIEKENLLSQWKQVVFELGTIRAETAEECARIAEREEAPFKFSTEIAKAIKEKFGLEI